MDKNIQKIKPSGIFTNYIYKAIPLAFDESMSYYETLCGILSLLKTQEEVVNNNADLLAELELYVQNYFKNLDVQTEINNKLDEMVKDGTLEEIIAQYVNLASVLAYNSVADMKNSTNLINGSFVKTYGFYSLNDGGGAYYKIRNVTTSDNVDNATLIAINNTLVAELIKPSVVDLKIIGVKGDGITDDTELINLGLSKFNNIIISDGTYMINTENHILPKSNTKITISKNATLKAITNNLDEYSILKLDNVENVTISGGIIYGDRETHTGTTGEWGHCIYIKNSKNITLKDIILKNSWGDGLYINGGTNINTENLITDNVRRNGYSLISVDGFHSLNDLIQNTNGTAPESGVDIEPNTNTEKIKNVIFDNLQTKNNNKSGFLIYIFNLDDTSDNIDITLNNYHDEESRVGITISKNEKIEGNININNPVLIKNLNSAIRMEDLNYNDKSKVLIYRPQIIKCNTNNNTTSKYGSGISLYSDNTSKNLQMGNVEIIEPFITNTNSRVNYINITSRLINGVKNISLINPLNNDNKLEKLCIENTTNLTFKDLYEMFKIDINYSLEINEYNVFSIVENSSYQTERTLILKPYYQLGRETTFRNINTNYKMNIKLPDTCYLRDLSNTAGTTISLNNYNSSITLKRISDTEFITITKNGNVTAS